MDNFLYSFFKEKKFLQDYPMDTKKFMDFCKKREIRVSEEDLEFFEKEKLFFPIFRIKLPKLIERNGKQIWKSTNYKLKPNEKFIQYSTYFWGIGAENHYLQWLEEGVLFNPSQRQFQSWNNFNAREGEFGNKIISFYSSFQVDWLIEIMKFYPPKFSLFYQNIKIKNEKIYTKKGRTYLNANLEIQFFEKIHKILPKEGRKQNVNYTHRKKWFKQEFDWRLIKEEKLLKIKQNFDKKLYFLLNIQDVYYPYARSGGGCISISGDETEWYKKINTFDTKKLLTNLNITINEVVKWYKEFSNNAHFYLGIDRDDWMQLWKCTDWNKKDNLKGSVRIGIDYLQWAIMLKTFIQDHEKREILDVDEVVNMLPCDILKFDLNNTKANNLRSIRNNRYYDPIENKNYYSDRIKRLYYLVNDFKLDYQPRVMVFVEGETEEEVFQDIWEKLYSIPAKYCGIEFKNIKGVDKILSTRVMVFVEGETEEEVFQDIWEKLYSIPAKYCGIEFKNIKGVDKILSTAETAERLRNLIIQLERSSYQSFLSKKKKKEMNQIINTLKKTDIITSNFQALINYNLEQWQIIPFFVADNEGRIKQILDTGKIIQFENANYNVPDKWKFIWGVNHKNKQFIGQNFEFANFSDDEIAKALNHAIGKRISNKRIKGIREQGKGINAISSEVKRHKVKIGKILFSNLFKEYEEKKERSIIDTRPFSELIQKIANLSASNHLPVDRGIEIENKEFIREQLNLNIKRTGK